MTVVFKKDKTPAYIMMILGGVLSVTGISFILKAIKSDIPLIFQEP